MEDTHLNYTYPFYMVERYEVPANLLQKRSDPINEIPTAAKVIAETLYNYYIE